MNFFDNIIAKKDGFPGYMGNSPTTKQEYDSLQFMDDWETKPSWEQLSQEINDAKNSWDNSQYQRDRAPEYPPIGDQLDALWKGGEDAAEMLAKVQAVKSKYPKPE